MRKFVSGLAILLALSLVTCEMAPLGGGFGGSEGELGYTDVVYSKDGRSLTLYLDGATVPETGASRALTRDLALAGHDYFEVVFYHRVASGTAQVARASWEIGERAGIKNVPRTISGISYTATGPVATVDTIADAGDGSFAVLFVGRKTDRTLLAIGKLTTDPITTTTASVTFEIQALDAGLRFPTDAVATAAAYDTFLISNNNTTANATAANTDLQKATVNVGSSNLQFPTYVIPHNQSAGRAATYALRTAQDGTATPTAGITALASYLLGVRTPIVDTAAPNLSIMAKITIPPRFPVGGGLYKGFDTPYAEETRVYITGLTLGNGLPNPIAMSIVTADYTFANKDGGVCSLTFSIPVYAITAMSQTGVDPHIVWNVRPGFGTSAYDLDDGYRGTGGAILLAVGTTTLNFMAVDYSWL
ncbi:MAG: hypothetical protein LBG94_09105 [Treponema sp.]|jgi:hypothetical protein|nr:hypothetical protein [Treponema sp.]